MAGGQEGATATPAFSALVLSTAYPLTHWSMYGAPTPNPGYTEFEMTRDGRRAGHLPIADLVPNTLGRAHMARLTDWVDRAATGDEEAADVVERAVRAMLTDLDDPTVDGVTIRRCEVTSPTRAAPAECDVALRVER